MQIFSRENRERVLGPFSLHVEYTNALNHVTVVQHPVLADAMRVMRSRKTQKKKFGEYARIASVPLLLEAVADLQTEEVIVETPLQKPDGTYVETPSDKLTSDLVTFVFVLRAGMAFMNTDILPKSPIATYDIERDEQTSLPHLHRRKLPYDIATRRAIICEPMLATGGTTAFVIEDLIKHGVHDIRIVSLFAAAQGVLRIAQAYPQVKIICGALDPGLNEQNFIVPGCGDFGDRFLGTTAETFDEVPDPAQA